MRRLVGVLWLLVVVLLAVGSTQLPRASAAAATQYGWWSRLSPVPPPGAPSDGLYLAHDPGGASAVAALRYDASLPAKLALELVSADEIGDGTTITAHPATSDWTAAQNGAYSEAPTFDAAVAVTATVDGKTVRFELPELFDVNGPVDVVLVAAGAVPDTIAFEAPGAESYAESSTPPSTPPTSRAPSSTTSTTTSEDHGATFTPVGGSLADLTPVDPNPPRTISSSTTTSTTGAPRSVSVAEPRGGFDFEVPLPVLLLGAISGMTYGVLAVGLILIYRSNRIINFAHGEIGAFGAAVLGVVVTRWHVPYWVALPIVLVLAAGVGGLSEIVVIRRLRHAPTVMSIVATLGLAQFLLLLSLVVNGQASAGLLFPQPAWMPTFEVGALTVTRAYSAMLFLTPVVVAGLALFLRRSRAGTAIRASASNADAARLSGVFAGRMSTLAWAIAGAISAFTAILVMPTRGFANAQFLGPGLLMRALAAAVIGRMHSLPAGLAAGLGVGIIEQLLLWNYPRGGLVEMMLFCLILGALVLQRRNATARDDDKGAWALIQPWPALPERLREVWTVRNIGWIATAVVALFALTIPLLTPNSTAITLVLIIAFAIVGLSVGVVTGLGGQLSLGQFALAGVGAVVSVGVTTAVGSYAIGFLAAGAVTAAVSLVIGLPALRIRGLMLAVTTLGFALASQAWLFQQTWTFGDGKIPGRPIIGDTVLDTGKEYYLFSLVPLAFTVWLTRNVWRSGVGRRLRAIRDNEAGARAFTVSATAVKLQGFMLAGFLAGVGGAVYGHALSRLSAQTFPVGASVEAAAMTVLGGIGVLTGPIIGAFYIIGIPEFLPLDSAGLATTSLGWLVLILYFPGGIAQLVRPLRERIVDALARLGGVDPLEARRADDVDDTGSLSTPRGQLVLTRHLAHAAGHPEDVLLSVRDLQRHFGGVHAVDGVTLDVRCGEIVGLIGPNGAGKTTLFELIGGFTAPDSGTIHFGGQDVTALGPEARARRGLIRSFQDASLFPTMTVIETVMLSLERVTPTRIGPALLGIGTADRAKEARARELVGAMGLHAFRNRQIRELSTGTRRITELACLVALEPSLLLLDEPASGIAQRETEALGELLLTLKQTLDLTLVVIEHDIPMVMRLADRVLAMESGRVIADGSPEMIRNDPAVIESYLGGDIAAIERSGVLTGAAT